MVTHPFQALQSKCEELDLSLESLHLDILQCNIEICGEDCSRENNLRICRCRIFTVLVVILIECKRV